MSSEAFKLHIKRPRERIPFVLKSHLVASHVDMGLQGASSLFNQPKD